MDDGASEAEKAAAEALAREVLMSRCDVLLRCVMCMATCTVMCGIMSGNGNVYGNV